MNAILHVAGSTVAATAVGFVLATLGSLLPDPVGAMVAVAICLGYGMMELDLVELPLPETSRQVPAAWRYRLRSPVTATLYGILLGPGFATRVGVASYVALLGIVTLACAPALGALVLGAFGFTRATAAAVTARRARRDALGAMSWGYAFAGAGRPIGFVLTFAAAGALAAGALVNHVGT